MFFEALPKFILPFSAMAFVIYIAFRWLPIFEETHLPEGSDSAAKPFSFRVSPVKITKKDLLAMLILTLVYGFVAFFGLGDRQAPESRYEFLNAGDEAIIELKNKTEIGNIVFFSGLHTGEYKIMLSEDGSSYTEAGKISQGYADLFKWKNAELLPEAPRQARFIKLVAGARLSMGEILIKDKDGNILDKTDFKYSPQIEALFDEQALLPKNFSFLNSTYFDEIYHARTALEHIDKVNPYETTHPPLGKVIIGFGIKLFGMNPFGWRFSGTVIGILMVPAVYLLIKLLTASSLISVCGTLFFSFDFMHYVQTRIATIDSYSVFFIILMYLFMWLYVSGGRLRYLALSGLAFGLGAASKWTCFYAGGGLAVIWLMSHISRRHEEDAFRSFIINSLQCVLFFIIVPAAVYYLSYIPYGQAAGLKGPGMLFSKQYLDIVIKNQVSMFSYHSDLVATHPYSSRWYEWIANSRPILYYLEASRGTHKAAFAAFLNPIVCWGGFFAMIGCFLLTVKNKSPQCLFVIIGYLAQLLPWVLVSRITFAYHYFPSMPFLCLALCLMFSELKSARPENYKKPLFAFTAVCVLLFFAFYPVLSGIYAPTTYTSNFLKWFPGWPF